MALRNYFKGVLLVILGGVGCSSPDADRPKLLDSTANDAQSQETDRLHRMQLVKVIDTSKDPEEVRELSSSQIFDGLVQCGLDSQYGRGICNFQGPPCEVLTCLIEKDLCVGEHMLAVADGTGSAVTYNLHVPNESDEEPFFAARIPPQSAASSAALAIDATKAFERVMASATSVLNAGCDAPQAPTGFSGGATAQAFATTAFMEAFDQGKRAYRTAFKHTLAVSDAELSSSNQLEVARVRAISKESLSRTAAAHLMIGGQAGWFGSTNEGFCTGSKLTGPENAALAILREAALNPNDVACGVSPPYDCGPSTDALVNGTLTGLQPQSGSVRARLADAWGATAIPANMKVWDAYGLTEADFVAAHRALAQEIKIFGRSDTAKLEPRSLPGGVAPIFERFAGATGKAPKRPDQYWALLALLDAPENAVQRGSWRPQDDDRDMFLDSFAEPLTGANNLAAFVDRAYSWARLIADIPDGPEPTAAKREVKDPLRLLLGGEDIRGRLMHCRQHAGDSVVGTQQIRVAGYEAADQLVLVLGQNLMDCAVNGHIEGARCVLPDILNAPTPNQAGFTGDIIRLTEESFFNKGPFKTQVQASFDSILGVSGRYYLIRPRQKGDLAPGPGQWELILGTPLFRDGLGPAGQFCRDIPIVPEAIERAAHAIAPSRDWCGSSEVSCAEGIRFDERLPLEDELSTDHDDLESSWRHYLDLARRAADHADTLGEEYVQASLQDDLRDEEIQLRRFQQEEKAVGEFQRIQEICGASANPNAILDFLGTDANGDLDLSQASDAECDSNANGPPICGLRKLAESNPEMGAIAKCLGTFGKLAETHLGDGSLCVANRGATLSADEPPVRVVESCQDDSSTEPDEIGPDTGCADPGSATNPRYHCVPVSRGLNMFNTASLLPDPPLPALCEGIRQLRSQPVAGDANRERLYKAIVSEHIFSADELASLGQTTNMKLDYQTFGAVGPVVKLQVGPKLVSSGDLTTGLCGPANTACPSGSDGLFCRKWNCGDAASRAELNLRLYKAGAALLNALPGDQARVDTLWYLNFYLQPDRTWGPEAQHGQWRVFDFLGNRSPLYGGGAAITVPQGTLLGFAMGAQQFNVEGPFPRATDDPSSNLISHPNNKAMLLAFRNAFMSTGSRGAGLTFDLLKNRPASQAEAAGSVPIAPNTFDEREYGLGTINGCRVQSGTLSSGCDLNHTNQGVPNRDLLQSNLYKAHLRFLSSTGGDLTTEVAPASQRAPIKNATVFGKQVFPAPAADLNVTTQVGLDVQARLDAVELACEALGGSEVQLAEGCGTQVSVKTVSDFDAVGNQLECLGNEIIHRAATAVYRLPAPAIENLRNGERVFDASGGAMATAISDLRASLLEAATSGPIVGGTLRRFGEDLRGLRAQLERIQVDSKIQDIQLQASIANQITSCLNSAAMAFTINPDRAAGGAAAAVVTCANSIAQIGFATQINGLQGDALKLDSDQALAAFSGRASDYVQTLESQSLRLSQALEGIQRNLEIIKGLKAEAQRSMQSALWMLSKQASNQVSISNALDNISLGKGIRYRRALEAGQKMAFLAKRAIEMRLGIPLADMVQDLPLVTAPASWEATVCQTTGIDYAALREKTPKGASTKQAESFADSFLGDYVTKLEQVVESYRLVNNFHEGSDTTVVSLRDDIHHTRAACDTESPNLLYRASKFEPQFFTAEQEAHGWTNSGCTMESVETEAGILEQPTGDCVVARPRQDAPFFNPLLGQPVVPGYDVEFGLPDWCGAQCAYQTGAALSQQLRLERGRYRFSWYTTDSAGAGGTKAARVRHADGTLFATADNSAGFAAGINGTWNRVWMSFDVFETETVTIGFERPSATDYSVPLGAPMLEKLEDPFQTSTLPTPPRFMDTTDERTAFLPVCEDRTGRNFRAQKWDYNCVKLCPDGYASDCSTKARTECFWETSFHVSQRSIEAGHIFNQSGFARGNFNYRIRSIGVNFVGTELHACADASLPSTCYAAGYIPYTLIHDGPYYVRNHKGQDYRAALFPGRIEHARGLGIERYITNPMSDADRTLMEAYMRKEFSGRPLDGDFILRVWDEPGVNFNAIEDVQFILDYGYWTRFN